MKEILNQRHKLDMIDNQIIHLLNQRKNHSVKIGELKKKQNLPIHDENRMKYVRSIWGEFGNVYDAIHELSKSYQK